MFGCSFLKFCYHSGKYRTHFLSKIKLFSSASYDIVYMYKKSCRFRILKTTVYYFFSYSQMFKFTIESQMLSPSLSLWLYLSISLCLSLSLSLSLSSPDILSWATISLPVKLLSICLSVSLSHSLHPTYYLGQLSACQQNAT